MERSGIGRWFAQHQMIVDVVLGLFVGTAAIMAELHGMHGKSDGVIGFSDVAAVVIAFAALLVRHRWPRHTLVAVAVAESVLLATTGTTQPALFVATVLVTLTMATHTERRAAILLAAPVAIGLYFVIAFSTTGSAWSPPSVGLLAWMGMATAAGDAISSRRAYVLAVEERARRAEQTREEEAARRVVQERVRIARELHDVVAHHIAVINVQAGAASHVLHRNPQQADQALGHIRAACETVLTELASIVGVLRASDESDSAAEPVRGLARLTDMLDALAAAGLTVERTQVGEARELPAVADLAAYRILQEALTNAHKYGTGTARVTITYSPDTIALDVVNPVTTESVPPRSGYGILGMKERATSAGGTIDVQRRPDGRFTVHAELPAPTLKATV
ncbi:two-component sensor histidine kinase [Kribbella antibiotica]|uniref:histidine kinase n=1 Tax=Kribbella antibiotica TaxID=190195 RepID=A0A4R4ZQ30_9ACTN|nr:histidine kinase [Kribbella antibiotica]TDD59969.1 two-component sensor histidine kinase [Kribbella antibiotica]